jgi:hypothetical protein
MEAENGKEFDPASSTQIPQAFAFFFWFLNVNPSVASVTSVANKLLIFFVSLTSLNGHNKVS